MNLLRLFIALLICSQLYSEDVHRPVTDVSKWQSTDFIWNVGLALQCDIKIPRHPYFRFDRTPYNKIAEGQIVWVNSNFIIPFLKHVFPKVKGPIVVVTNDHFVSLPLEIPKKYHAIYNRFLNNPKLKHWFTQNYAIETPHPKISPLPLGIDFHTLNYISYWGEPMMTAQEQEKVLRDVIATLQPTHMRKRKIYADFQHNDSMAKSRLKDFFGETRTDIFNIIEPTGLCEFNESRIPRRELWAKMGQYAFVISPPGAGLDTHRTWEALAVGCIVIVKSTLLDPVFEGLPVIPIKDWHDITEENLTKWHEKYHDAFTNPEYRKKLTNAYWMNKIREARDR